MEFLLESSDSTIASPPAEEVAVSPAQDLLDCAKLLYRQTEFSAAYDIFVRAMRLFKAADDRAGYVECLTSVLRIAIEREQEDLLAHYERDALRLLSAPDLASKEAARLHNVLGVSYLLRREHDVEVAMQHYSKASELALAAQDFETLGLALYGCSVVHRASKNLDKAKHALGNLERLLQEKPNPDVQCSALLLRSLLARMEKDFELALKQVWLALEHLRSHPNFNLYLNSLILLGETLVEKGDCEAALLYLELAHKTMRPSDLPRLCRRALAAISSAKEKMAAADNEIVFDERRSTVTSGSKTKSLNGQTVLAELLKLFVDNPERDFSKEELTKLVWNEDYDPQIHDNKVYVTIRRLRRLVDSSSQGPSHIVRTKNGYRLCVRSRIIRSGAKQSPLPNGVKS